MKYAFLLSPANRKRLQGLLREISHRLDDALLDLAEGVVQGIAHPELKACVYINAYGDQTVFDKVKNSLIILAFTTVEDE